MLIDNSVNHTKIPGYLNISKQQENKYKNLGDEMKEDSAEENTTSKTVRERDETLSVFAGVGFVR